MPMHRNVRRTARHARSLNPLKDDMLIEGDILDAKGNQQAFLPTGLTQRGARSF